MITFSPDAVLDVERLRTFLATLDPNAAQRALAQIWLAVEKLEDFPLSGMPTENPDIRQIVVRFGGSGYIIRYALIADTGGILITRIWHGREARR